MTHRRLAIVASHPIQYQAPFFRELAKRLDLTVLYTHQATAAQQAAAGFGVAFDWDSDLTSGYRHQFLRNVARDPSTGHFNGCDTPEVGRRLRSGNFDAVLVLGWHLKAFWQATIAARLANIPAIVRSDSQLGSPRSLALRAAKRLVYPPALRVFAAALYVGQRSREYFEAYGYPSSRLFFAPHAVDEDWFRQRATTEARDALRGRLGLSGPDKLVLFAGKLVEFKRPMDVVRGAARLRCAGLPVSVAVAGDGPLATELRRQSAELNTPLHSLGFLNQSEIPAAYAAADLLVLPSTGRETWGLVANEALACGLPILVSDAVGCAPDLAQGSAGRTFRVGDIDHLSQAMRASLSTPVRRSLVTAATKRFSVLEAARGVEAALDFVRASREQEIAE